MSSGKKTMLSVLYAKKLIIPSTAANTLQSLHMAAAFAQAGAKVSFYPGYNPKRNNALEKNKETATIVEAIGIEPQWTKNWKFLTGSHKGIYGLLWRSAIFFAYLQGQTFAYARDLSEAAFLIQLKRLTKSKASVIYEAHEILHSLDKGNSTKRRRQLHLEKNVIANTDGIVVTNSLLVAELQDGFSYKKPLLVEENGINPKNFISLPLFSQEQPWPQGDEPIYLLYIGKFIKGKGVAELIQSLEYLPLRFRLRIVGSGDKEVEEALYKIVDRLPEGKSRVEFTGYVPQSQLRKKCLGCHIAVIPQQKGGDFFSPLKLYEVLALGLPTVATPVKAFESQDHLVHVASDTTPQALAQAIILLADSPDRAKDMREAGMQAAAAQAWEKRASRILAFAEKVALQK